RATRICTLSLHDALPILRLWSLYVPNGRSLEDPHYTYKLDWLAALREDTAAWLSENPDLPLALMGDWNVAPTDADQNVPGLVEGDRKSTRLNSSHVKISY